MEARNPDKITPQLINMFFPPDDQPNLAESGEILEEAIYLDEIEKK